MVKRKGKFYSKKYLHNEKWRRFTYYNTIYGHISEKIVFNEHKITFSIMSTNNDIAT